MSEQSIVVTGIGAFSPIGATFTETWDALLSGASGAHTIAHDWVAEHELPVTIAAETLVEPGDRLSRIEAKRLDRNAQVSLIAAREAWEDAGSPEVDPVRLGVDWATGIGGVWTMIDSWEVLRTRGARRVLPLTVTMLMPNAAAAAIELEFQARAGARTVVSACASSTESISNAIVHLRAGYADVIIAGGGEACVHPLPMASFSAMQALSKRNDDPERASRPFDLNRDGFVLGEGAAALVLETEEHARARGARIYARVVGGGLTSDAGHITQPSPAQTARAMSIALADSGHAPTDVVHVNAHATSTPVGDLAEYTALRSVYGDHLDDIVVTSTKGATGHLLGAAGAIEAAFTVKALQQRVAPPTINYDTPDPEIALDVPTTPRQLPDGDLVAVSNSFGFGGHNAVAVFTTV